MGEKISIIIPVYNAEEYLKKSLDSIVSQTFLDFEALLIDDGSSDGSLAICNEYAEKDSRFKVFHKENGGVSSARNLGIDNACGVYTIHLDSDDYIAPNMFQEMYEYASSQELDILLADYYVDFPNEKTKYYGQVKSTDVGVSINNLLSGQLHGSVCNKLIRTSLYVDHKIRFSEDISFCEDLLFVLDCLLTMPKIGYLNKAYLHYVQREDSRVHTYDSRLFKDYFSVVDRLEEVLNESYGRSLAYFKLTIKRIMLVKGNFTSSEMKIYPESNKYIFSHPSMRMKHKLSLFAISMGGLGLMKKIMTLKK